MQFDLDALKLDQQRIAAVYGRRSRDIPSDRYSSLNPGNLINQQELEQAICDAVRRYRIDLPSASIVEFGCGSGYWIRELIRLGAEPDNITGIDLLPDRLQVGRHLTPSGVTFMEEHAASCRLEDQSFDLALQFTMFSSILDPAIRTAAAKQMLRVTRPGAHIFWYDFFVDNPKNRDVVGIGRSELKELFVPNPINLRRLTLLPPLARALGPKSRAIVRLLASSNIFSTHYFAVVSKV